MRRIRIPGLPPALLAAILLAAWMAVPRSHAAVLPALPGAPAASPAPSAAPAQADPSAAVRRRLAEAQAELQAQAGTNLPVTASGTESLEYRLSLQGTVRALETHLEELAGIEDSRLRLLDLERTTRNWSGFTDPPPWSLLLVDELWDSIQSVSAHVVAGETSRGILEKLGIEARALLQSSDEKLRQVGEELERTTRTQDTLRLNWLRSLEQARNRAAAAQVASLEARQRRVEVDLMENRQRLAFLRRQHALASQQVRFSADDLQKVLSNLELTRLQLEDERRTAEATLAVRQKQLAEARDALRNALANPGADAAPPPAARLEEVVQIRGVEVETSAMHLRAIGLLTDSILAQESLWERRYATFGTEDLNLLREAYGRLERLESLLSIGKPYFLQQIEAVSRQIAEQQNRLRNQPAAPADSPSVRDLLDSYRQRDEFLHRGLDSFERTGRLVLRWREALDERRLSLPLTSRVRDLFGGVSSFASKLWSFELFAVEDTITVDGQPITGRRSITVGKVALAALILVLGTLIARALARWTERLAVRRFGMDPNQASLIRRWIMVVLVIGLVLFSLVTVRIPLTVFAFAGGALAIGVGFGTQNLLKNFISGIIILFERPFIVGDILDVGGRTGTVTSIGIRSSVLMLWDSTETLIPNSALLENNLTNWTFSNRHVRFSVQVAAAYGSDTRRVAQVLSEVADRHGLIQKEPKPIVLFMDFAESSLAFELRYWVDVTRNNSAQIASDLRHMIAAAFKDQAISIAFPQRDIHLDSRRPIQVELQTPKPPGDPAPPPSEAPRPA